MHQLIAKLVLVLVLAKTQATREHEEITSFTVNTAQALFPSHLESCAKFDYIPS